MVRGGRSNLHPIEAMIITMRNEKYWTYTANPKITKILEGILFDADDMDMEFDNVIWLYTNWEVYLNDVDVLELKKKKIKWWKKFFDWRDEELGEYYAEIWEDDEV